MHSRSKGLSSHKVICQSKYIYRQLQDSALGLSCYVQTVGFSFCSSCRNKTGIRSITAYSNYPWSIHLSTSYKNSKKKKDILLPLLTWNTRVFQGVTSQLIISVTELLSPFWNFYQHVFLKYCLSLFKCNVRMENDFGVCQNLLYTLLLLPVTFSGQ